MNFGVELFIKRPVLTSVISIAILVLGIISFSRLETRDMPNIEHAVITVQSFYPGASASFMEENVTSIIEESLKGVKDIENMTSSSAQGFSNIILIFKLSANLGSALEEIRSKILEVNLKLPSDMKSPVVSKYDSDSNPSFWISASSKKYSNIELTHLIEERILPTFENIPSTGFTKIFGGEIYNIKIELIPSKLYNYKISPIQIERTIKSMNKDYPGGKIITPNKDFIIMLKESANSVDDYKNIVVKNIDGCIIKLEDIANIKLEPKEKEYIIRYNGRETIAIGIARNAQSNVITMSKQVRNSLEELSKEFKGIIDFEICFDGSIELKKSVDSVFYTIIEAVILVVLVMFLFLRSPIIAAIPLITIPISLIGVFFVMNSFGFSINMFTLLAMVIATGLVVDDAIVVLENIYRNYEEGLDNIKASIKGSREVFFAVISMTATLAVVFIPVGFIEGFVGKLFMEFAWTLAFCVIISGIVAVTLIPMLSSLLIKYSNKSSDNIITKKFDIYFNKFASSYYSFITFSISRKKIVATVILASFIITCLAFIKVNKEFLPIEDRNLIQMYAKAPVGASLDYRNSVIRETEEIIRSDKNVKNIFSVIGSMGVSDAFSFIFLKDKQQREGKISQRDFNYNLAKLVSNVPGMNLFTTEPSPLGGFAGKGQVEFKILSYYQNFDNIDKVANQVINDLNLSGVFNNINKEFVKNIPAINVKINHRKASFYGVDAVSVPIIVNSLYSGKNVGNFKKGRVSYDVIMGYSKEDKTRSLDLDYLYVPTLNNNMISLSNVANITLTDTPKAYSHYDKAKSISISCGLSKGYNISDAKNSLDKILSTYKTDSIFFVYTGDLKKESKSRSNFLWVFVVSLIFIYLILSAQFESFLDSILIIMAVPFSIIGGILLLWISGYSLNVYSNVGFVTLIGLITKNSIMLVEFANQLKSEEVTYREAMMQSIRLRFRPIMMTTISSILGSMPLVLESGPGMAVKNSLGYVITGGLGVGTLFTLIVIPILYIAFKKDR